jgi:hypothetical protein
MPAQHHAYGHYFNEGHDYLQTALHLHRHGNKNVRNLADAARRYFAHARYLRTEYRD